MHIVIYKWLKKYVSLTVGVSMEHANLVGACRIRDREDLAPATDEPPRLAPRI
jgi:hypothetical protein